MPIYTIEHLNLSFPDPDGNKKQVLTDIDISIAAQDCIGILGKSGSGKTQLVQALAGLNEYRSGEISSLSNQYIASTGEVWNLSDKTRLLAFRKSEIGYIFQEPFSYFNPTLKMGRQLFLDKSDRKSPDELPGWFVKLGLEDHQRILSSYPHQLSGGQLQRIAILSCLIRNPRIVIADEITASLDPDTSRLILKLLTDLKKDLGFALLWVTHDELEATQYCNRIWIIEQGRLIADMEAQKYPLNKLFLDNNGRSHPRQNEILKLRHIHKSFLNAGSSFGERVTKNVVLHDISFSVFKGEVLGIIGPSGGGKSTLAKIVAGMESWDQGEIYFNSKQISSGTGVSKEIIYLFQDAFSSLNPQLTCRVLLDEAWEAGQRRVDRISLLSLAQLDESLLSKKAISLSGGLRQRFALARALAVNPDILIMDESVNALDIPLQKQILDMLSQHLKTVEMTIIFISHQLDVVRKFAGRIIHLREGRLVADPVEKEY